MKAWWIGIPVLLALQQPQPACSPGPSAPPPAQGDGPPPVGDTFVAADGTRFLVETFARNLEVPWALAFAPDGRVFVTERPGRVRIIQNRQLLPTPALTLDDVSATAESGLLGIALHPDFSSNHLVFIVYTANVGGGRTANRLARYREVNNTLAERAILVDDIPAAQRAEEDVVCEPRDPRAVRLDALGTRVEAEERLLQDRYGRIREVVSGPDGFLYFTTSNRDGRGSPAAEDDRILRIRPAS